MTFEEVGRILDTPVDTLNRQLAEFSTAFANFTDPTYRVEARLLAEDAAERGYDLVQRNNVEVTCNDGNDSSECYYYDGSEWEHVKTYDPSELRGGGS